MIEIMSFCIKLSFVLFFSSVNCEFLCAFLFMLPSACPTGATSILLQTEDICFRQREISWLYSEHQLLWKSWLSLFGLNAQPEASLYEHAHVLTNIWVWVWPFAGNALPAQDLWKLTLCFCEAVPSGSMFQCNLGLLTWVKESRFWFIIWLCLFHI